MQIFNLIHTWFSIKLSLFYKTLIVPERRRPRLSQCSVKRRLREGGGRKLESLCLSSSSSGPAPGSCWRWESHSKQWEQERRLQLPEISAAWSYHRRRRSPSHPDTLAFTQHLNIGNNENILKKGMDCSRPILLHLEQLVDVSRGVRDCLRLRMSQHQSLVSEQGLSINIFFSISSKYLIHE